MQRFRIGFYPTMKSRFFFVVAGLLLVTACGSTQETVRCPDVRVPSETGNLTRFGPGDGRDITDVVMEAQFEEVRGECSVSDDEVEVAALVKITARQGPASSVQQGDFGFFVAVTDRKRNILSRRSVQGRVDFSGNRSRVTFFERLKIDIPKTEEQAGDAFLIFVGFELTRDEVEFNRAQGS